ncbi:MAG: serine/threonine protein kinase [Prevotellaceae bacterium]|jgi:serine/threonine-protein kinase|nr:serine/threonine protein kinase [Prevotellaceae bacterium]
MQDNNTQDFRELQSGIILCNGKYTIEKKIGEGGFGITYKAMQSGLNRTVCIKEYFLDGKCVRNTQAKTVHLQGINEATFEKYRQAFVKEARTLANLKHPNIVEVIDVFDENNTSYMVMPFIEGQSLQSIVEKQGKLLYPEAVNYIAQVAGAVGYIHERHILHRDIKPDNVMITADYKAILIDFGSAREFEHDKTQAHTSMLTHGYAPTEQYTTNSRKGAYTDIYAIGATSYFALTGQAPLEAAARMTEKMPEPKELNPAIPDEANRTILKAMQLKAENRHQNVQEFMDDLRNIKPSTLVDETIGGTTVVVKGRKWLWWVVAIVLVIGGLIVGWVIKKNTENEQQIVLQQKILAATQQVNDSIRADNVYYIPDEPCYHLFRDCNLLGENAVEGSVQEAFESNVTQLCENCASRVAEYRKNRNEANNFKKLADDLNDVEYYNLALEWCGKALQMCPDNIRMLDLKQQIEQQIKNKE